MYLLQGFGNHVKTEHNMWAYIFFFIHLDDIKTNDYTAMELYVHRLVRVLFMFITIKIIAKS